MRPTQTVRPPLSLVAIPALVVIVGALVYTLLPFKFAGTISCSPALLGGRAQTDEMVWIVKPKPACKKKAKSRLLTAASAMQFAVLSTAATCFVRPPSRLCDRGDHDACRAGWPAMLGPVGQPFACHCPCHQDGL